MVVKADVHMGWLDRLLAINFQGELLQFGVVFQAQASGPTGTVAIPILDVYGRSTAFNWKNNLIGSVSVGKLVLPPNAPDFSNGPISAFPNFDVTSTVTTHSTFHVVDHGRYVCFQVGPGGFTVTFLTDPFGHTLIPFEIDWTNTLAGPTDPTLDLAYALPGLGHLWYKDRLNEMNVFFPGIHSYAELLVTEISGHDVTTNIDNVTRNITRNFFVDPNQFPDPFSFTLGVSGTQWRGNTYATLFKNVESNWPLDGNHDALWNPPAGGPPSYPFDATKLAFITSGAEGSSAVAEVVYTVSVKNKTITQVVHHL